MFHQSSLEVRRTRKCSQLARLFLLSLVKESPRTLLEFMLEAILAPFLRCDTGACCTRLHAVRLELVG